MKLNKLGVTYQPFLERLTPTEVHMFGHFVESFVVCRIKGEPELLLEAEESQEGEDRVTRQLVDEFFQVFRSIARKDQGIARIDARPNPN